MIEEKKHKLIVAIDFGTTYSGVAFVYTGTPGEIEVVQRWPGAYTLALGKVPTEIAYDHSVPEGYRWGYSIKRDQPRLSWFKLLLDPSQSPLSTELSNTTLPDFLEAPPDYERRPEVLVADYLKALLKGTGEHLLSRYGRGFIGDTGIDYIMTTPACWSDKAKDLTMKAARAAGINPKQLKLVSEPEAAATYTLQAIQPNGLTIGDHFVVCDAGGGTVDLITYELMQLEPKLTLKESVVGKGALCGSIYINRRFEAFVENKVGTAVYCRLNANAKAVARSYFDDFVKRDFCDDPDTNEYHIPIPGLPDNLDARADDGFIIITRHELREVFEPVIKKTLQLVHDQVRSVSLEGTSKIAAVCLVGGFGASLYLKARLEELLGLEIPVLQPINAWTAVVRGAVITGLQEVLVSSRLCRYSYGCTASTKYRRRYPIEHKYFSDILNEWRSRDFMCWYLKKGQNVSNKTTISLPFMRQFKAEHITNENTVTVEDSLYIYTKDQDALPEFKDYTFEPVCILKSDVGQLLRRTEWRTNSTGIRYKQISYTLDMTVDSASIRFELKYEGKSYGEIGAEFI